MSRKPTGRNVDRIFADVVRAKPRKEVDRWESLPSAWIRERRQLIPSVSEMASRLAVRTSMLIKAERGAVELPWPTICLYREILENEKGLP